MISDARQRVPAGRTLPVEVWARRHRLLVILLLAHAIGLTAFGIFRGYGVLHVTAESSVLAVIALLSLLRGPSRALRGSMTALGLMASSGLLVHLSGGSIESHFHFFVVIGLLSLYQDWLPYVVALAFVVLHHGVLGTLSPDSVFNHPSALSRPWLWAAIHGFMVLSASAGNLIAWKINEDDHTSNETALRESQKLFASLAEAAFDGVAVHRDGVILEVNPAFAEMYGYRQEDLAGKTIWELLTPEAGEHIRTRTELLEGPTEVAVRRADGTVFFVETVGRTITYRGTSARVVACRDITQRHEAERAVREAEERFRLAFDNAPIGVALVDTQRRFLQVNQAVGHLLGRSPESLLGATLDEVLVGDCVASCREAVERLAEGQAQASSIEARAVEPDGRTLWLKLSLSPLQLSAGPAQIIVHVSDITQQKWSDTVSKLAQDVTLALGRAADLESGLQLVLRLLAEATGADFATAWLPDSMGTVLVPAQAHHTSAAGLESLRRVTESYALAPGEGVVGRVWATNEPFWSDDLTHERGLVRVEAATQAGLTSVLTVPIVSDNDAVAVLELFSRRPWAAADELLHLVTSVTGQLANLMERKQTASAMAYQALHDDLTGLPNRGLFEDRLRHARATTERSGKSVAVLLIDLDDFRTVNDSLGHYYGDDLLLAVSERLRTCVRDADTLARLGGDEFAVLLEGTSEEQAIQVTERVLDALRPPFPTADRDLFVTASVGVTLAGPGGTRDLLRDADAAMYAAKRRGKACYALFEPEMHVAAVEYLEYAADLRVALERDELHLVYQPIVALPGESVVGVEALLRWGHPTRGVVSPANFIPIAEETGLIVPIGRWVLLEACRQLRAWDDQCDGGVPLHVSVNVSGRQIHDPQIVEDVADALQQTGIDPQRLTLEITESVLMQNPDLAGQRLRALKQLGVRLAVDDFGTGYSSLSYLSRFPVDVVKIDKSFIDRVSSAGEDAAIARAIIRLGQALGLEVVAEGVEQPEQSRELRRLGCPLGQGFLFSRPLPADGFLEFLKAPDQSTADGLRPTAAALAR